uniref:hypothetical protein n=1 Tax=Neobacillus dielmonensis TaxID=1347369 RepID=UPI0038738CD0
MFNGRAWITVLPSRVQPASAFSLSSRDSSAKFLFAIKRLNICKVWRSKRGVFF